MGFSYDPERNVAVITNTGKPPGTTGYKGYYGSAGANGPLVGGGGTVTANAPYTANKTNKYFGAPAVPPKTQGYAPFAPAPAAGAPAITAGTGLLRTPGEQEQWWTENKARLFQPSIMTGKSYAEELYESGNQGLNTFYDRARDKGQKRLEDSMWASGLFGSGATAKASYELEGELGAAQARDMAGLASTADASKANRDRQLLDRDQGVFGMAGDTQRMFQDRERLPLQDKTALATKYSEIFRDMGGKSTDEQARIGEEIIQSIIAEGGVSYQAAAQQTEDLFRTYGIALSASDLISRNKTASSTAPYQVPSTYVPSSVA